MHTVRPLCNRCQFHCRMLRLIAALFEHIHCVHTVCMWYWIVVATESSFDETSKSKRFYIQRHTWMCACVCVCHWFRKPCVRCSFYLYREVSPLSQQKQNNAAHIQITQRNSSLFHLYTTFDWSERKKKGFFFVGAVKSGFSEIKICRNRKNIVLIRFYWH